MFRSRYRYLFIALLAGYSYLNILFTGGDRLFGSDITAGYLLAAVTSMVALVWEANRWLFRLVEHHDSLLSKKLTPLVPFFLISLPIVVFVAAGATYATVIVTDIPPDESWSQFKLALAFAFRINLFLHTINAIIYFNDKLKNTLLETERLKTLSIESQFEALRNQINPHFLFNSLNVLSGIVHKDADLASDFIKQLANVYRYLLYNQENKTVPLRTEMEFIDAFVFLVKMRFADQVVIDKTVADADQDAFQLPPASVQLLVENAIKHNVTSRKNPLHVAIFVENDFLVVQNTLQQKPKETLPGGMGLTNVKMRYQHLVDREVQVLDNGESFTVKLPLIKRVTVLPSP
jgi:hypothetical protein